MTTFLTLRCQNDECLTVSRIGHHQYAPATVIGQFRYCPKCGGSAFQERDNDRDYWEVLADRYKIDPELLKDAFNMWDRQEHYRFYDFIQSLREEAGI